MRKEFLNYMNLKQPLKYKRKVLTTGKDFGKSYYMMNSLYYLWLKRLFLELDIINNTPPSLIPNVYVKLICFLKRTTYTHLLARSSIFFLRFMYWKRITKAEGWSIYGTVLISQVGNPNIDQSSYLGIYLDNEKK